MILLSYAGGLCTCRFVGAISCDTCLPLNVVFLVSDLTKSNSISSGSTHIRPSHPDTGSCPSSLKKHIIAFVRQQPSRAQLASRTVSSIRGHNLHDRVGLAATSSPINHIYSSPFPSNNHLTQKRTQSSASRNKHELYIKSICDQSVDWEARTKKSISKAWFGSSLPKWRTER